MQWFHISSVDLRRVTVRRNPTVIKCMVRSMRTVRTVPARFAIFVSSFLDSLRSKSTGVCLAATLVPFESRTCFVSFGVHVVNRSSERACVLFGDLMFKNTAARFIFCARQRRVLLFLAGSLIFWTREHFFSQLFGRSNGCVQQIAFPLNPGFCSTAPRRVRESCILKWPSPRGGLESIRFVTKIARSMHTWALALVSE